MKSKIKRHSRAVISVILTLCMVVSCMTVGLIATDAAKVTDSGTVGAKADSEEVAANADDESVGADITYTIYFENTEGWSELAYYLFTGSTSPMTWPGIRFDDNTSGNAEYLGTINNGHDVYKITITTDHTTIIFNNNKQSSAYQTNDLSLSDNNGKLIKCDNTIVAFDPDSLVETRQYYIAGRLSTSIGTISGFETDSKAIPFTKTETPYVYKLETGKTFSELAANIDNHGQYFHISRGIDDGTPASWKGATDSNFWLNSTNDTYESDNKLKKGTNNFIFASNTSKPPVTDDGVIEIFFNEFTGKFWFDVAINDVSFHVADGDGLSKVSVSYGGSSSETTSNGVITVGNSSSVTFTATPSATQSFVGWYSDAACATTALSTDATYTATGISADYVIYGKFADKTFTTISISAEGTDNGSAYTAFSPLPADTALYIGSSGNQTADSVTGGVSVAAPASYKSGDYTYKFAEWYSANGTFTGSNNRATTFKPSANNAVAAARYKRVYTVTNNTNDANGTASASPMTVLAGESYTITAVGNQSGNTRYALGSLTINDVAVSPVPDDGQYTVMNVSSDQTFLATFTQFNFYVVTLVSDDATYGMITSAQAYNSDNSTSGSEITNIGGTPIKINVPIGGYLQVTAAENTSDPKGTFDGWSLTANKYKRESTQSLANTTFKFYPNADMNATAKFSKQLDASDKQIKFKSKITSYDATDFSFYTVNEEFTSDNITHDKYYKRTLNLVGGTEYKFRIYDPDGKYNNNGTEERQKTFSKDLTITTSSGWQNIENTGYANDAYIKFKPSTTGAYTFYWAYTYNTNLDSGKRGYIKVDNGSTDTIPDGAKKVYVRDGANSTCEGYGDSVIDTTIATSGLVESDILNGNTLISESHSTYNKYYYVPGQDVSFRVVTTITDGHQAMAVRGFVVNGYSFNAELVEGTTNKYYADITIKAGTEDNTLEVIPVYKNKVLEDNDLYLTFYVDANSLGNKFGKTIGYYAWDNGTGDDKKMKDSGAYPGQPLMRDGDKLVGYLPKKNQSSNASTYDNSYANLSGVLLTNLAENSSIHKSVLTDWGASTGNYQSFDYKDPYHINQIDGVNMILYETKYSKDTPHYNRKPYNGSDKNDLGSGKSFPSYKGTPTASGGSYADYAAEYGFERLTNIDNEICNIFNDTEYNGTAITFDETDPLFVVSVGNQTFGSSNTWNTSWVIYNKSGTNIATVDPSDLISTSSNYNALFNDETGTLKDYKDSPVFIDYENWLKGSEKKDNSGTRFDGRWLYTTSSEETNARIRLATVNEGTLDFFEYDGIGKNAVVTADTYKTAPAKDAADTDTKYYGSITEFNNRETTATAQVSVPSGYKLVGMYVQDSSVYVSTVNGFSSSLADYNSVAFEGTSYTYTNVANTRIVAVLEPIPETDLTITHTMYTGDGAHRGEGFFYYKAEIIDTSVSDPTVVTPLTSDFVKGDSELVFENLNMIVPSEQKGSRAIRITLRSTMAGSNTFVQWYRNFTGKFETIDSTSAFGQSGTVEKEVVVGFDTIYGEKEDGTFEISALNFQSDIDIAGSVYISHELLPASVTAGFSGDTFASVKVYTDSTKNTLLKEFAESASTITVGTTYIKKADTSRVLEITLKTTPGSGAAFESFWKDSDGTVVFTETPTTSGSSTLITFDVNVNDFFDGDTFDTTKQNVIYYSELKQASRNFKITYEFPSRFAVIGSNKGNPMYGTLKYVKEGTLTSENMESYFDSTNNHLKLALLRDQTPYENNFMVPMSWYLTEEGDNRVEYGTEGEGDSLKYTAVVKASTTASVPTKSVVFYYPYQIQKDDWNSTKIDGKTEYAGYTFGPTTETPVYSSSWYDTKTSFPEYGQVYAAYQGNTDVDTYVESKKKDAEGKDTEEIVKTWTSHRTCAAETLSDGSKFLYWSIRALDPTTTDSTSYVEVARCYSPNFNFSLFDNYRVYAMYDCMEGVNTQDKTDAVYSYINFLEYSRNHWNNSQYGSYNTVGQDAEERNLIYTDFNLTFEKGYELLKSASSTTEVGVLVERVDTHDDGYLLNPNAADTFRTNYNHYVTKYASEASTWKANAIEFIKSTTLKQNQKQSTGECKYDKRVIRNLTNKNRTEYAYALTADADVNHIVDGSSQKLGVAKDFVYRAYTYVRYTDKDNNEVVQLCEEPVYFSIKATAEFTHDTRVD